MIKEEIIHILESLCGVAEGSRVDNVEKLFGFLHPLMVESVKLLGKVIEHLVFNYQVYRSIFPFSCEILGMVKLHLQIQNLIKTTTTTINTPIFDLNAVLDRTSFRNKRLEIWINILVILNPGPQVIKLFFFMLLRLKFILLINVKMPTIVGISTFISRMNYRLW